MTIDAVTDLDLSYTPPLGSPWDAIQAGANLGGQCRTHHQLKQLPGWQLTQDAQGHFTWRTPAGLDLPRETTPIRGLTFRSR